MSDKNSEDKKEVRELDIKNVFNEDLSKVYINCETSNTETGGFFPVGVSGKWHSGIHVIQDCVYPLMSGKIVAYRNFKLDEKNTDYGANFYLIEHEIKNAEIKFYTLYFHIASDEKVLNKLAPDGNFVNIFYKIKLPFYKKWSYKVSINDGTIARLQLSNKPIFQGSWFRSLEQNLSVSNFYKRNSGYPKNFILNNIKFTADDTEIKNVYSDEADICDFIIVIKSFTFKEEDLLYSASNNTVKYKFNYTKNESKFTVKEIEEYLSLSKTDLDKASVEEYEKEEVIIPREFVEKSVGSDNNKLYSITYSGKDNTIYRVRDNLKSQLNKKSCPLIYTDVTSNFQQFLKDDLILVTEKELNDVLIDSDVSIKAFYTINKISDNSSYYFLFNSKKQIDISKLKFFYEGISVNVNSIDFDKFFNKKRFNSLLTDENYQKRITNISNIIIFEVKESNVYKLDAFQEFKSKNLNEYNKYAKIIKNSYIFCTRYIHSSCTREYSYNKDEAIIEQIRGKIKNNAKRINKEDLIQPKKGILLFNNFDSSDFNCSNPMKIMKDEFTFETELLPEDNIYLTFNNIKIGEENYAANISKKDLIVSCVDEKNVINRTGKEINLSDNAIEITPGKILGYSFYEDGKNFYDLNLILKNNFMKGVFKETFSDNNYYIYKKLPDNVNVFYDNNEIKDLIIPKDTEFFENRTDKINNFNFHRFMIKRIPIFFVKSEFSDRQKFCKCTKIPNKIYLNNDSFVKGNNSQLLVDKFYSEWFHTYMEYEYIDNNPEDNFKGLLIKNTGLKFWIVKSYNEERLILNKEFELKKDEKKCWYIKIFLLILV